MCRKSVAILKRLDWLKRLSYQDARNLEHLPESTVALDPDRLLEEMHVVTPNRRKAHAGFRAFRWIAGRLPLLWMLWPFLFIPGVPWLGQKLYRWIARHRYHLVPCRDGACALPAPKKQSENPKPDAAKTA
jgi:predicted DCC family thiol-disulfide oxidoreductase YuxK